MAKENDKKEEKRSEIVKALICEKCKSNYVYSLSDNTLVCRKCGHRTLPKN